MTGKQVAHRLQCAAMTRGCTAVIVFAAEPGIDIYHLDREVLEDCKADDLLRVAGWRLDHGRWICGAHEVPGYCNICENFPCMGNHPPGAAPGPVSETPGSMAMWAATEAVRKVLASAKNPRTLLGRRAPTAVAYAAACAAVEAHAETLAHERARAAAGICRQCGRIPEPAGSDAR